MRFSPGSATQTDSSAVSRYNLSLAITHDDRSANLDLGLTEEQTLLQRTVRDFAETEVKPLAKELDETGHFPREIFRKAA
ncbi:MAG: acyl-CoA dehydrogenase family protein, partial [Blastocatellia bacterium]